MRLIPTEDKYDFVILTLCIFYRTRIPYFRPIAHAAVNTRAKIIIKHPCFDEMRATGEGFRVVGGLDNTDRIMNDTFWVGVYPGMTDEMIDYMAKTITEAVNQ